MTNPSYHRIILESILKRYGLPPTRREILEPHPPFIARVTVQIGSRHHSFSSNPYIVRAKAEDQACRQAIIGLEGLGYKRLHFKSELNNIVQKARMTLDFQYAQSGPENCRLYTSTVMINGQPCHRYTATSTSETHADELACKLFLEAYYPEYRYV